MTSKSKQDVLTQQMARQTARPMSPQISSRSSPHIEPCLGISIGQSFAEVSFSGNQNGKNKGNNSENQFSKRWYLPLQNMSEGLTSFFQEHPEIQPKRVQITSQYLEKLMDKKFGGSAAHLVTNGMEELIFLRQPTFHSYFETCPKRNRTLQDNELIFGINERTTQDGAILRPLETSDLEFIASKLQMMKVEKICISFLHSNKNPTHELQAKDFFASKGFWTLCSHQLGQGQDEVPRWRKNFLNAGVMSTFIDLKTEIEKALAPHVASEKIFFWSKTLFQNEQDQFIDSLLGHLTSLVTFASSGSGASSVTTCDYILHFGVEQFLFIDRKVSQPQWISPWGPVDIETPKYVKLSVQPTMTVESNLLSPIAPSLTEDGFEPGPVTFGRSLKLLVFDIFALAKMMPESLKPFVTKQGLVRAGENLSLLAKSHSKEFIETKELSKKTFETLAHRLGAELTLRAHGKRVLCTGAFATTLVPWLKKHYPFLQFDLSTEADYFESIAAQSHCQNSKESSI